uniref:Uncharacterized protein n=1 Tax=Oryza punctata TaxID=4537 RepID=A0A0E0LW97_ORYPU
MARALAVASLLLVALAVVARPLAQAVKDYPADAPAAAKKSPAGKADTPATGKKSSAAKADAATVAKESTAGKTTDTKAAAKESTAGKTDATATVRESTPDKAAAKESPTKKADAAATEPSGGGYEYVQFVIKNPVKAKEKSSDRADGLPIDPTPDGQMMQ